LKRFVFLVLLFGCTAEEPPPEPRDPVVVYAAFENDARFADVFARYREETGVLVIVRRGPAERIVGDVIDNDISPPADMLMTNSVVDAWRAAEESALRPLMSKEIKDRVPEWARDADDLWVGTGLQSAVIVHDLPNFDISGIEGFPSLAEQRFTGALCLSSSGLSINRSVMAMMIDELGVRPTELIVRDWVKNLAAPPFETEARLVDALNAGACGIAIVSHDVAVDSGLKMHVPETIYADVSALGIARHARNPEGAVALAEWLVAEIGEMQIDNDENISRTNVSRVALYYEDAVKLAERARYP
jgi:iron(III) transport system substrate-binding protein